jgi:hydrogenase maturation factor
VEVNVGVMVGVHVGVGVAVVEAMASGASLQAVSEREMRRSANQEIHETRILFIVRFLPG